MSIHPNITSRSILSLWLITVTGIGSLNCGDSQSLDEIRRFQEAGNHKAAIEPLRTLLETRPGDPEVLYRYGIALSQTGRAGVAVWPLREAMTDPDWEVPAGSALALALTANGAHNDAIEVCDDLLESEPDSAAVLLMRANARISSRRDYEGALADADRILELEPDHIGALVPRAVALLALEREEEAAEVLAKLDDVHRDESLGLQGSPGFCAVRAIFAEEREEAELAERRFNECLEGFPDDATVVKEAVAFFDGTQRGDRSMEIIEEALERNPAAYLYRASIAMRLQAQDKEEEAIAELLEGTQLDAPADVAMGWVNVAGFYVEIGRYDDAVAAYEKALASQPDPTPDLLFDFADALVLAERYERAQEIGEQMTVPAHRGLVLGRVQLEQGHPEKALDHFDQGLKHWPDNAIARYYAAVAAERAGDLDRAIEEYRYAIRADASGTDANLRLGRIYEAEGNDEMALSVLKRGGPGMPGSLEAGVLRVRILARKRRVDPPPGDIAQLFMPRDRWALAAATRARGYRDQGGASLALATLRQATRLDLKDPQDALALEVMIDLLAETGAPEEGIALVRDSLAAEPDSAIFHALHGRALAHKSGTLNESRSAYERSLSLDATTLLALLGLAELEAELGATDPAIALYARAVEVAPTDPRVLLPLAEVLVRAERFDEAVERLEELLRWHPHNDEAAFRLAQLLLERGETQRAENLAQRAVRFGGGSAAEALGEKIDAAENQSPDTRAARTQPTP